MEFYESISSYYDFIFPVDPDTLEFLAKRAPPRGRVLDLACGTGGYSIALAGRGSSVVGTDIDAAMIGLARAKGAAAKADFRVMDMLEIGRLLEPGFDLIFCIGNSIVHLESEQKVGQVLADCHRLLAPGGSLVVQIINYDRILAGRITELPTLRSEERGLEFVRKYDFDEKSRVVQFRTELRVREKEGVRTIQNRVPLWILRKASLERLAAEADFRKVELFGGFDGRPFSLESLPLILCAWSDTAG